MLAQHLTRSAGINRLGRLVGIQSIARNTASEDDAYNRDLLSINEESDEMDRTERGGIMAAGDITFDERKPPNLLPAAAVLSAAIAAGAWFLGRDQATSSTDTDTRTTIRFEE